jgi:hypothetical protein
MTKDIKNEKNTLSLGGESPKCLSETEPETYGVITWAINMTPNPTVESIYKICGAADELHHLDQREVKTAIAKALEQRKAEKR